MSISANNLNMQNSANNSSPVGIRQIQQGTRYVACPPADFYRFSVFDELNLGRNTYNEMMHKFRPQYMAKQEKNAKLKNTLIQSLKLFASIGALCVAYKYRASIKNAFSSMFITLKNVIKK